MESAFLAVSYTHLDVYKRQLAFHAVFNRKIKSFRQGIAGRRFLFFQNISPVNGQAGDPVRLPGGNPLLQQLAAFLVDELEFCPPKLLSLIHI